MMRFQMDSFLCSSMGVGREEAEEGPSMGVGRHWDTSRRQVSMRAEDLGFGGVFSRALSRFLRESMMEEGAKVPVLVARLWREVTDGMVIFVVY